VESCEENKRCDLVVLVVRVGFCAKGMAVCIAAQACFSAFSDEPF
jgi:hypothetical protein